jgi:hypothetical protein
MDVLELIILPTQGLILALCKEASIDFIEPETAHNRSIQNETIYCICQTRVGEIDEEDMIECTSCHQWYHGVCVNANRQRYKNKDSACPVCRGNPPEAFIPRIF